MADTPKKANQLAPWGVEVGFVNDEQKSTMHAVTKAELNDKGVTLTVANGTQIFYRFDDVRRVLLMRSKNYDRHLASVGP